jgi:hypothetical protein
LRTQANVLARSSVFVVANEKGVLNTEQLTDLLVVFSEKLKDRSSDDATFARLMTLLNALWDNFGASFEDEIHFTSLIGVDDADILYILERIGKKYLNKEQENTVGKPLFMNTVPYLTFVYR